MKLLQGTDFTATSGTDIVLSTGATAGDIVDIVAYGSFELANLNSSYNRTTITASSGQTNFSASYTVGIIQVYKNGVLLEDTTDYTAEDGSTVVLTSGATEDDIVDIVSYNTTTVTNAYTQSQADARFLQGSNNLSDLGNTTTAISNLGLDSLYAQLSGATFTGDVAGTNFTLSGYLRGPSSFTIDPATHGDNTGTVVVAGNLQVNGTTTTVNSTTMDVADLNITIADGAANPAAADGAGITVDGASATILYTASTDSWDFNKPLSGTYNKLHGVVSTITTVIDFDQPINKLTMSGNVTFTESNKAEGKSCLLKLETAGNTPTFSGNIKWASDQEPTWGDHGYWVISFICDDATNVFASATGHTI